MIRLNRVTFVVSGVLIGAGLALADLAAARAEQNLERRARAALENADRVLKGAQKHYKASDWGQTEAKVLEVQESVELAMKSLKQTGKDPRRHSKHFKRAEIRIRNLLRQLDDFGLRMSVEERERIQPVQVYLRQAHDDLLGGIMGTSDWTLNR